jgi:predicted DNA-binding transcriptional regulator AlpA
MTNKYLTTKDLVERYSVTPKTIYNWRKKKGFPDPVAKGKYDLYITAEIDRWESKNFTAKKAA